MPTECDAEKIMQDIIVPRGIVLALTMTKKAAPPEQAGLAGVCTGQSAFLSEQIRNDIADRHDLICRGPIAEMQRLQANFVQRAITQFHRQAEGQIGSAGNAMTGSDADPDADDDFNGPL